MAEFDFNQLNQSLINMRFGAQSGGSDGGGGGADTYESVFQNGLNKSVQNAFRIGLGWLGIDINPDIEGKSATAGLDPQAAASSMSLTSAPLIRAESGGGWLSMVWDTIKKYMSRDLIQMFNGSEGGDPGGAGGGSFADTGGGFDSGGSAMATAGGGGDIGAPTGVGSAPDVPDVQVNYGGRMMSADAFVGNLGNLTPQATPVNGSMDRDFGGVSM